MLELETLLQAQKAAKKSKDYKTLTEVNRQIFAIREAQRKANEKAREDARYNILSTRISRICEKIAVVEKCLGKTNNDSTLDL